MARRSRKTVGDKTRFEVFKRDSFKCQYCGRSAPDIVLRLDHIQPVSKVSKGGPEELLNYATACMDCNSGKGARELSDDSVVTRQKQQMHDLNERRIQIEMMLQWRQGLSSVLDASVDGLVARIDHLRVGWSTTDAGRANIKKWLRTYTLVELLDATEAAAHYIKLNEDGRATSESGDEFFDKIPRIASVNRAVQKEPHLRDMFYIRKVLKNNVFNWNWRAQRDCLDLLRRAIAHGTDIQDLKWLATQVSSFTRFEETVQSWMKAAG